MLAVARNFESSLLNFILSWCIVNCSCTYLLWQVKMIVKPGCSQAVLKAALSSMACFIYILSLMSSPSTKRQTLLWADVVSMSPLHWLFHLTNSFFFLKLFTIILCSRYGSLNLWYIIQHWRKIHALMQHTFPFSNLSLEKIYFLPCVF